MEVSCSWRSRWIFKSSSVPSLLREQQSQHCSSILFKGCCNLWLAISCSLW